MLKSRKAVMFSLLGSLMIFASSFGMSNAERVAKRFYGSNRSYTSYSTAKFGVDKDSKKNKVDSVETIVIANGYSFQDCLSAMNIVNKYNAKLITISTKNALNEAYGLKEFKNLKNVYILSGYKKDNSFLPVGWIKDYIALGVDVKIIEGRDFYDTNKQVLKICNYRDVGVASGNIYADALSAFPMLKENNLGLLLVDGNKSYNKDGFNVKYTFGGVKTVKQDGGERISGRDRYQTSTNIASKTGYKNLIFVDGKNYADALSSVNIAKQEDSNIILTPNKKNQELENLIKDSKEIFIVGGQKSVPDQLIKNIFDNDISIDNTGVVNAVLNIINNKKHEDKYNSQINTTPKVDENLVTVEHPSKKMFINVSGDDMKNIDYKITLNSYDDIYYINFYSKALPNQILFNLEFARPDFKPMKRRQIIGVLNNKNEPNGKEEVILDEHELNKIDRVNPIILRDKKAILKIINNNIVGNNGYIYKKIKYYK